MYRPYKHPISYHIERPGLCCWAMKLANGFWSYYADNVNGTTGRDGAAQFDGKVWRSQNGRIVSCPQAVMDDFGFLVAVRRYD